MSQPKPFASRPRIAVFSGPTATVHNSQPLVTSNKARQKYGLPLRTNPDGTPARFDLLRPQRLAAPVTAYVCQFSAHPLEADAAELYGPPDGYLNAAGILQKERKDPEDIPVYEVTLRPEDGLYSLPYMARQANGQPWEGDCAVPGAPPELARQPFYPDASRIFEEIDRLGVGDEGVGNQLSAKADFDFYRASPPGGYKKGLPAASRTDMGEGDIPPEVLGRDFFPYRPPHLRRAPYGASLARLTNVVHQALATGRYAGAVWLEGSPTVDESLYWLSLLIPTTVPITGCASQRPHGAVGNEGDRNIIDAVDYVVSGIWAGEGGQDTIGGALVQDEQIFSARDVQKADARPGGYVVTGGHGGIVGTIGQPGPPHLTYRPARRHTHSSAVNLNQVPAATAGVRKEGDRLTVVSVQVKNDNGELLGSAIPKVTIAKFGNYMPDDHTISPEQEVELQARIEKNLRDHPLAGFVGEGGAPYGTLYPGMDRALERAVYCGMPVVKVGRGNAEGFVPPLPNLFIAGSNLTANKARLLLMACLLKLGALPPAADPSRPTAAEREAIRVKVAEYQAIFDSH